MNPCALRKSHFVPFPLNPWKEVLVARLKLRQHLSVLNRTSFSPNANFGRNVV